MSIKLAMLYEIEQPVGRADAPIEVSCGFVRLDVLPLGI
jgi:hypothetical protein